MKSFRNLFFSLLLCVVFLSQSAFSKDLKVGIVFDKGGKDDKSFNAAAYQGALKAKKEFGIKLKTVEATDDNALESLMRTFAKKKYDIIFGIGIAQVDAVKKTASKFPGLKFAIVDAEVDLPNVRSLLFEEHQGSYLVGAIAALKSKTGKLGFIGGMDIPLIRRFQLGFESGAKKINPKIKVVSNYIGVTGSAWNNPPKAKELAVSQFNEGADVVFAAAGASNLGLFDAAEELNKYAIGVDSNQNWIKPGRILTSMLKRVDIAVFSTIEDMRNSKFSQGVKRYGLSNDGVGFSIDQFNKGLLSEDILVQVNKLKSNIEQGSIRVPDYYVENAKK